MHTLTVEFPESRASNWLWAVSFLGILWNLYGLYQFAGSFTQSTESLMTAGMTRAQAEVYLGLPVWISVVFAVGVIGGVAGSFALALRRRASLPIYMASLLGYCMLFAGDTYYGVFAAIPSQLAILGVVVLIAVALLGAAWLARKRGLLR